MDFDPFCVFLCFKVHYFWTLELALKFFFLSILLLKQGKFKLPRWNCSYRASKSRRNSDIGGWKQIGTFPPSFNNCSFCSLLPQYLTSHVWMLWQWFNLTSKKNPKLWNIFKNAGCLLFKGAVIQLYKKRSFEIYELFISNFFFFCFCYIREQYVVQFKQLTG